MRQKKVKGRRVGQKVYLTPGAMAKLKERGVENVSAWLAELAEEALGERKGKRVEKKAPEAVSGGPPLTPPRVIDAPRLSTTCGRCGGFVRFDKCGTCGAAKGAAK